MIILYYVCFYTYYITFRNCHTDIYSLLLLKKLITVIHNFSYDIFYFIIRHVYTYISIYHSNIKTDMAWPTKGSGKSYNSHTGFGHMIGCYSKKVISSKIYSRLCRICESAKAAGVQVRNHDCVKNWNESSKKMESAAALCMVVSSPTDRGVVILWIISDDDSVMRAVCSYPEPENTKTKGKLPKYILQPIFKADPSHRVKVVAKKWYKLKNKPIAQSTMTGDTARRLKRSWGYMLKQNREGNIQQFTSAAKAVVNHLYNDHQYCGDWCQAVQAKKMVKYMLIHEDGYRKAMKRGKSCTYRYQKLQTNMETNFICLKASIPSIRKQMNLYTRLKPS